MNNPIRILGIDPGLQKTGWGVIIQNGSRLSFVASGLIKTDAKAPLSERLSTLNKTLQTIIEQYAPHSAAVEETFVNANPQSALKLGQARGVCVVTPATAGLPVGEYSANCIKKAVVGAGKAAKGQVGMMIRTLLPACGTPSEDEADALAVAICHAHHSQMLARIPEAV